MTSRNRGKQSNDDKLFSTKWRPIFTKAADDMGYLLSRKYGLNATLQVVGNRYRLNKRQRDALSRIGCGDDQIQNRRQKEVKPIELKNKIIEIDGFNLLILMESLLSGAYVFKARDGLYRDISSVHGSYKRVMKTEEAVIMIGNVIQGFDVKSTKWYFDSPVSNSGRLKTKLYELSEEKGFNWEVELVFDPDKVLAKSDNVVISSDGWILDQADQWFNLGGHIIENLSAQPNNVIEV